jgi:hypothetical protein
MPRENSFTDSEGRSLTPEPDREALSQLSLTYSPQVSTRPRPFDLKTTSLKSQSTNALQSPTVRTVAWQNLTPKDKFRASVHKVMALHRNLSMFTTRNNNKMYVGAEPGVDPRRVSAEATYGHMIHPCRIEVVDYSAIRNTHRVLSNDEFVDLMDTGSPEPPSKPPWAKVRWINICGLSWDVMKAVSIAYGAFLFPSYHWSAFDLHNRSSSFGS